MSIPTVFLRTNSLPSTASVTLPSPSLPPPLHLPSARHSDRSDGETDDGVDAETSLSLSLHLYLSSPPLHFILTLTFGQ